jgi:Zn-dependent protease with chaperone function
MIAGPADREDFFAAQRRHRRAALLLSWLAGFAVVLVSVPLAAIVFPLLFFVLALLSMLAKVVTGAPSLVDLILGTGGHFAEGPNALFEAMQLGLFIVLPGSVLMLWMWRRILKVLGSLDTARFAELFGARLLQAGDLEERQVANIVEELAIAAGIAPPAVRIVDSDSLNAVALVPRADAALVLVTRGLLNGCNRAETQALLGSTIAMIANGDAQAAFRWMGVAGTFNVAADLLHGPLAKDARERLKVLVAPLRSGSLADASGESLPEAARAIELLLDPPPSIEHDESRGRLKIALVFPFLMASAMFNLVGFLANLLFLSPALALLTRRRFHLADATAVQLTRDPDSLAAGLNLTVNHTAAADWPLARFRSVFLVAPTGIASNDPLGQTFGTHPTVARRHERVMRMLGMTGSSQGANPSPLSGVSGPRRLLVGVLLALLTVLLIALVPLMLYLMIAVTLFALVVGMLFVMIVLAPLRWLLG